MKQGRHGNESLGSCLVAVAFERLVGFHLCLVKVTYAALLAYYMDEFMNQGEYPASRRIAPVQSYDREGILRDRKPPHLRYFDIAHLKHENSQAFDGGSPGSERQIVFGLGKLDLKRNPQDLPNVARHAIWG